MIPIQGLFEAHVSVRDFERSVAFYRDVVRLELRIAQPERPAAFFWVGGRGASVDQTDISFAAKVWRSNLQWHSPPGDKSPPRHST